MPKQRRRLIITRLVRALIDRSTHDLRAHRIPVVKGIRRSSEGSLLVHELAAVDADSVKSEEEMKATRRLTVPQEDKTDSGRGASPEGSLTNIASDVCSVASEPISRGKSEKYRDAVMGVERQSSLPLNTAKKNDSNIRIFVTDPMGAVQSRERRASSVGCWSLKSQQKVDEDEYYHPAPPNKLPLEPSSSSARDWADLPTPTSDREDSDPPLALSSHDRIMQVIRCFPFPSPRSSPRESPRLKRRSLAEKQANTKHQEVSKNDLPNGSTHSKTDELTEENVYKHAFGQLVQVSVETMAITALPKESIDCWLKERLKKWIQLSGHEGSIIPASSNSLYKKQTGSCTEGQAYQAIQDDPALRGFAPRYYQQIEKNDEVFIEIEDLLSRFADPAQTAIMDIKIGTRTFLESEVSNAKLRKDLYEKMVAIDPFEATEEERKCGEITKLRYMQFRERESSTAQLGFRIEAAKTPGGALEKNFKKVHTASDVMAVLRNFFGSDRKRVVEGLLKRLRALRTAIERSSFFSQHEVVGSSLLMLFDGEKVGVWMIDFAKASRLPSGRTLTHRAEWTPGNAEDGYLVGIDNLIQILEDMPLKEQAPAVIESKNS